MSILKNAKCTAASKMEDGQLQDTSMNTSMNSGGVLFVARPRFVFLLGLFDAPLPLLVAFTPAFIL